MSDFTFRAIWPIVDMAQIGPAQTRVALTEVPELARRAHARITGKGSFRVMRSRDVPGSGRVTECVLVFDADAEPLERRPYWRAAS